MKQILARTHTDACNHAYVHKKPRMLIATKEWNYEDKNWDNHFIHITNQSINVKCNEYDLSKQNIKFIPDGFIHRYAFC